MILCDWIMVVELGISIVLLIYILLVSTRPKRFFGEGASDLAVKQRNCFLRSSLIFRFILYWCILTSLLSTLIVLYIGCFEDTNATRIKARMILYSALSLFTTIAPYVVNLLKLSNRFREAYCVIHEELLEGDKYSGALKKCEELITSGLSD